MGGRKGPEKKKFLVRRPNPVARARDAPKDSTLEVGESTLEVIFGYDWQELTLF